MSEEDRPQAPDPSPEPLGLGSMLREAREEQGLSRDQLATELKIPLRLLAAMEEDRWGAVPPGRERPLARQLAARLRMDLDHHPDALGLLPGQAAEAPADPRLERLERGAMVAVALGSVALLAWLVIPGRSLRGQSDPTWLAKAPSRLVPPPPPRADGPYPVLGEMLPDAPRTAEGLLVTLRAQDACDAEVVGADGVRLARSLQVSDPWKLRVKGPFTLSLTNAGVVQIEVAGRAVASGASVGEAWSGRFDENGQWLRPKPPPVPAGPLTQEPSPDQAPAPPPDQAPETASSPTPRTE